MDCIAAARGALICFWPDFVELRPSQFSLWTARRVISSADVCDVYEVQYAEVDP